MLNSVNIPKYNINTNTMNNANNNMIPNADSKVTNFNFITLNINMINNNQNFLEEQIQFNPNEFNIMNNQIPNNQFNSTGNTDLQQSQNQSQNNTIEEMTLKFSNSNNINSIINIKCKLNELFNDVINRYWYIYLIMDIVESILMITLKLF